MERAQDIMDCLWVKIGENAFINRTFIYDYVTYGTTAVCGLGGNFPQGGGINQWVQQITVGGYKATEDEEPVGSAKSSHHALSEVGATHSCQCTNFVSQSV